MGEKLWSPKDVAGILGVSHRRVLQFIEEGRLEATRVSTVYVIRPEALARFNRENPRKPGRPWGKESR